MQNKTIITLLTSLLFAATAWPQLQIKNSSGTAVLMHITATGETGIGTTAPGSHKLNVNGTANVNGALSSTTLNTGQGNYELYAMNQNVRTSDNVSFATASLTGFRLGTSTTAGRVLTADASGYGTWQAAPSGADGVVTGASFGGTTTKTLTLTRSNSLPNLTATFTDLGLTTVTTDASLTGSGTTAAPLSLGWSDQALSGGSIAVKVPGAGQTRVGYLSNFSYANNLGDEYLQFTNSAARASMTIQANSLASLNLMGQSSMILMSIQDPDYNVMISATPENPTGYTASTARIYTNAGLVTEGNANRFVGNVAVGMAIGAPSTGRLTVRSSGVPNALYEFYVKGHALIDSGLVVGNPNMSGVNTLTDKGWIKAEAVWDDAVMLTDYVFDYYYDGQVRPEDRDQYGDYRLMPISDMIQFMQRERHLPTIIGRDEWNSKGKSSLGSLTTQLWETVETQAIYIKELKEKLDEQTLRIEVLEQAAAIPARAASASR